MMDKKELEKSLRMAIQWLTGPGRVADDRPVGSRGEAFHYRHWNGAIRGEYAVAEKKWDSFCPCWHTGQAVKALVLAARALNEDHLLTEAEICAGFLLGNQLQSGPDAGLILAYEDHVDQVNTSAVLESLDGLFLLGKASGKEQYTRSAMAALNWEADHSWQPDKGMFFDSYHPVRRRFEFGDACSSSRPLLDDAVFLTGWEISGESRFRDIAVATAETLLKNENPDGNWLCYLPCQVETQTIHPRHAYWWGRPMLKVGRTSGDDRYIRLFRRSVQWYSQAIRRDGGLFRGTGVDFNTDSFGHATSGSACACMMFMDLAALDQDLRWMLRAEQCLDFCMKMQLTHPADPRLEGAIIEKILPPDGSEQTPYYIRDLGTIFFIQAAAEYLLTCAAGK